MSPARPPYADTLRRYGRRWPRAGYGGMFRTWLADDTMGPYHSHGNGSAMRVSPVGWAMATLDEVMVEARRSAECTHDHPDGIAGAQAQASAVFLAHHGASKSEIRDHVERTFGYDLRRTVPQALIDAVEARTDPALLAVSRAFCERFAVPGWP